MTGDERGTSRQHVEKRQLKQKIKNQKFPPEADKPFPPWAGLAEKVRHSDESFGNKRYVNEYAC